MKYRRKLLTLLAVCAITIVACGNADETTNSIPPEEATQQNVSTTNNTETTETTTPHVETTTTTIYEKNVQETIEDIIDETLHGPTTTILSYGDEYPLAGPAVSPGYAVFIEEDPASGWHVGECWGYRDEKGNLAWDHKLDCQEDHKQEVYHIDTWEGLNTPTLHEDRKLDLISDISVYAYHICEGKFEEYTGQKPPSLYGERAPTEITYNYYVQLEKHWEEPTGKYFYCIIEPTGETSNMLTRSWRK